MTHSNAKDESSALIGILIPALKGTAFAVGTMLLLAALFSGVSLAFGDPDKVLTLFAYAAFALSSLFCGMFSMVSDEQRRIIVPIISSALYVLVLVVLSLFVKAEESVPILWRVIAYAVCVLLSVFGGFIVSGRRKSKGKNTKNPAALMRKRVSGKK